MSGSPFPDPPAAVPCPGTGLAAALLGARGRHAAARGLPRRGRPRAAGGQSGGAVGSSGSAGLGEE